MRRRGSLSLPLGLQGLIERTAQSYLEAGGSVDFSSPAGEPALAGPDSVCWQVFRNPVSLFSGRCRRGDPGARRAAGARGRLDAQQLPRRARSSAATDRAAAMVTVYGPRSDAEAMISRIVAFTTA
jgi:uncharacterized protein (DUF2236 family)